jgi:hypothetical protein
MLTWMGRLWPLVLIGIGGALLYQALRSQRTAADDQPLVTPPSPTPTTVYDSTVSDNQESGVHEPAAVS